MDKRLLYVLPLCFAIVLGYAALAKKLGWAPEPPKPPPAVTSAESATTPPNAANADAPTAEPAKSADAPPPAAARADDAQREFTLEVGKRGEPGHYRATFTNRGAALVELRSGNHFDHAGLSAQEQESRNHWMLLTEANGSDALPTLALRASSKPSPLAPLDLETALWRSRLLGPAETPDGIEFELAPGSGLVYVKRFTFPRGTEGVRLELEIRNESWADVSGLRSFVLTAATGIPNDSGDTFYSEPQAVAATYPPRENDLELTVHVRDPSAGGTGTLGAPPIAYAGLDNKYFALLLRGADEKTRATFSGASWRALRDAKWLEQHPGKEHDAWRQLATDVDLSLALPAQGKSETWTYDLYAGPKARESLVAALPAHAEIVDHDLGFTSGIAKLLLSILNAFASLTGSWGVAIILLTLTVRIVLFPLNRRSQTAMARYQAKMKRIQPRIEEVKKKYAKDPQKLRTEQARIMQEEGAFPPLGGCLPPLLQLPVFIGLFRAVGVSFDLRHAPFLGVIGDLSLPDRLIPLDVVLPLVGHVSAINVLPPLMVVMWIWQQRTMPMPTDEQARMMYKMMMWMPVVMGIFLYNYAAGLSLYMITQSGLGIIEQKFIKKHWPLDETEQPRKKSGFLAKLAAAQQQKMKQVEEQRALRDRQRAKRR